MKMFRVVVNGIEYRVGIEELPDENFSDHTRAKPVSTAAASDLTVQPKAAQPISQNSGQPEINTDNAVKNVAAPMPGTIISVAVTAGTNVSKGQTLMVLEAMKMENEIKAPSAGTVKDIRISQGTSVNAGDILVVLAT